MELIKLSIANPKFIDPDLTNDYTKNFKEERDLLAYKQYAFAAWNIVETIIDRRENDQLQRTWDPVIKEENNLHRAWLNAEENRYKFKKEFWDFMVKNNEYFPCLHSQEGQKQCLCPTCNDLRALVKSKDEIRIAPRQLNAPQ